MSFLQVSGISKQEEGRDLLKDITFTQQTFQNIAVAGATGSGKTTLMKIVAGLVQPNAGEVLLEGIRVKGPDEKLIPGHPQIAYLSQHFELLHHYRVEEILEMVNQLSSEEAGVIYQVCRIDHLLKRWTYQLSGGEKQRIALARLLITSPRLLLLDEPYSNLDAIHKNILKSVIHDIGEELNITISLVSHNPVDVLSCADEIIILQQGQIIQRDSPLKVYYQPVNEYAAALFGKYNILSEELAQAFAAIIDGKGKMINSLIRPEHFRISHNETDKGIKGEVKNMSFMGSYYEIEINIGANKIIVYNSNDSIKKGNLVYVSLL